MGLYGGYNMEDSEREWKAILDFKRANELCKKYNKTLEMSCGKYYIHFTSNIQPEFNNLTELLKWLNIYDSIKKYNL